MTRTNRNRIAIAATAFIIALIATVAGPALATPPEDADEPGEGNYSEVDNRAHFTAHVVTEAIEHKTGFPILSGPFQTELMTGGLDCFDDVAHTGGDANVNLFQHRAICYAANYTPEPLVEGYGDSTPEPNDFGPDDAIHRDQTARILARAHVQLTGGDLEDIDDVAHASTIFDDVQAGNPHGRAITYTNQLDPAVFQGYDHPHFGPNPGADYTGDDHEHAGVMWVGHTHLTAQRLAANLDS